MIRDRISLALARFLTRPVHAHTIPLPTGLEAFGKQLRPADVILVEGSSHVSTAIKYLTQSTWSHAAIFVGDGMGRDDSKTAALRVIEADVVEGVRAVPLESFAGMHCRVCRPIGLSKDDAQRVSNYAIACLGRQYDLRNVFDLARYLLPTPPVLSRWRRRMIALGSGDPTRAICSTLIAQAFGSIHFPILPVISLEAAATTECPDCMAELYHARHHSLYVPRDFDVSPYFEVIKPKSNADFDFHVLNWAP